VAGSRHQWGVPLTAMLTEPAEAASGVSAAMMT
jgi:hypothetical protein